MIVEKEAEERKEIQEAIAKILKGKEKFLWFYENFYCLVSELYNQMKEKILSQRAEYLKEAIENGQCTNETELYTDRKEKAFKEFEQSILRGLKTAQRGAKHIVDEDYIIDCGG